MAQLGDAGGLTSGASALLVTDVLGEVKACSPEVDEVLELSCERLRGRRLPELLVEPSAWSSLVRSGSQHGYSSASLGLPGGRVIQVRLDFFQMSGSEPQYLVILTPQSAARLRDENQALLHALFSQTRVGFAIHDTDLLVTRINVTPLQVLGGDTSAQYELPLPLNEMLVPQDADVVLRNLRRVLETGEPLVYWEHRARLRTEPEREWWLATTSLRLEYDNGSTLGVASVFTDITEQYFARRRAALLHSADEKLGSSLDITQNAEYLLQVLVPDFADLAAVDLSEAVLGGEEPGAVFRGSPMHRAATAHGQGEWPSDVYSVGDGFVMEAPPDNGGAAPRFAMRAAHVGLLRTQSAEVPVSSRWLLPQDRGDSLVVPLWARGQVLGTVVLWRSAERAPFSDQDATLADEVGSRAALGIENARRYKREQKTVETLQRSLLPQPVFELTATQAAGNYVPAATAAGTGGSWYDVIQLSSSRVAFVMGDVSGHGLGATATMGRLRTAVQTLTDLDLPPDELLTRLDDLVVRLAETQPHTNTDEEAANSAVGATCLYCVYDPVDGRCTMVSAGRLPPLIIRPNGSADPAPLNPGPPFGTGGTPFDSIERSLEPGSVLAFFSEELIAARDGYTRDQRLDLLREQVAGLAADECTPAEMGERVLDALLPDRAPANDVALLIARVQPLPETATVGWQFPADPQAVARARDLSNRQLEAWNLPDQVLATELIVSELVTNAVRYTGGPIQLRLIHNESLICEVSDPSETQPHLRRARPNDEGGRGLFLVAQLSHRWGSRYTASGKTIWTEQLLD
ncbi:SpoIIE family protein phosphatase [Streptomyces oryzae]|uniref:SpoIIE family protein phosphatase n=1 Tax=Streptomyces oryzae TaxID=1434886 RepID=A0ABS3X8X8_9ACTN|nr:SpoIIE family protein phosphatase [Streptomyces oryzae]MBO8191828.1 SpoIIE family protein phosphatase [Streptomyces oryzae]